MAGNRDQIVVPGKYRLYRSPKGTAAPADEVVALAAAWVDLGYTRTDGASFTRNRDVTALRYAQSDHPVRHVVNELGGTLAVDVAEWSRHTWDSSMQGTAVEVTPGHYKWTPKDGVDHVPYAWLLELVDGTVRFRVVVPSGFAVEDTEIPLERTADAMLALRVAVEGGDGVVPWYCLGNLPAFNPAA